MQLSVGKSTDSSKHFDVNVLGKTNQKRRLRFDEKSTVNNEPLVDNAKKSERLRKKLRFDGKSIESRVHFRANGTLNVTNRPRKKCIGLLDLAIFLIRAGLEHQHPVFGTLMLQHPQFGTFQTAAERRVSELAGSLVQPMMRSPRMALTRRRLSGRGWEMFPTIPVNVKR